MAERSESRFKELADEKAKVIELERRDEENKVSASEALNSIAELASRNQRLFDLIRRAMEYGVNGSRIYSGSEANKTGDDMKKALAETTDAKGGAE